MVLTVHARACQTAKLYGKTVFLFPASLAAKSSRPCQLGPGMPIPATTPFTRSTPMLAEGTQRVLASRRAGASSADGRRVLTKRGENRRVGEEVAVATATVVGRGVPECPYRLLMRPTIDQAGNPHKLFVARPRPPMTPKPFHNLPNFRKPGFTPPQELHDRMASHKLPHRPARKSPSRDSRAIK